MDCEVIFLTGTTSEKIMPSPLLAWIGALSSRSRTTAAEHITHRSQNNHQFQNAPSESENYDDETPKFCHDLDIDIEDFENKPSEPEEEEDNMTREKHLDNIEEETRKKQKRRRKALNRFGRGQSLALRKGPASCSGATAAAARDCYPPTCK